MILKQMTEFAIETANIPKTQESSHVEITSEDMNSFHKAKQSSKPIMWKY
jgi:hypothetical protein